MYDEGVMPFIKIKPEILEHIFLDTDIYRPRLDAGSFTLYLNGDWGQGTASAGAAAHEGWG